MLSPKPINNLDYYIELGKEDYYHNGGEPLGQWQGKGALALGMSGTVSKEQFKNIMHGYHPATGKPLCRNPGLSHRPGWDLTFNADKNLSILWARSDVEHRREIQLAHDNAVNAAIRFTEKHAAYSRTGAGGVNLEPLAGLVFTVFQHGTSRSVDNLVPDMHLHSHALLVNAAPRLDEQWRTVFSHRVFQWQMAIGAAYQLELACNLQKLGYTLEQRKDGMFQISGIPEDIRDNYSKRANQIETELEKIGVGTSASKQGDRIVVATRATKQEINRETLFKEWKRDMDNRGFTLDLAQSIRGPSVSIEQRPLHVASFIQQLTERQAVFREQDLYKIASQAAIGSGLNVDELEAEIKDFKSRDDLVLLDQDKHFNRIYTMRNLQLMEQRMVRTSIQLNNYHSFSLKPKTIERAINSLQLSRDIKLTEEQEAGVYSVCKSQLDILQGSAGAGKSVAMRVVRLAYEMEGYRVIGTCISQQAVMGLEAETGIKSLNVAQLLNQLDSGRKPFDANTVLIVDEAGQLGTKVLDQLFSAAELSGSKIVLTGEDRQLDAIEYGGALSFLSRKEVIGTTRINTILRQRAQWARDTVELLRDGQSQKALDNINEKKLIYFCKNKDTVQEKIVNDWMQYQENNPNKNSIILAHRWKDIKDISLKIRGYLQAQGKVGKENVKLKCHVSSHDLEFTYSVGDRVKFCKNDYRFGLHNGLTGSITQVEGIESDVKLTIQSDDGRILKFNASEYANEEGRCYLSLAYCLTVYGSQGITVDGDTFLYYTSGMDRAHSYVAGSRAKDNTHWYINNNEIDELRKNQDRPSNQTARISTLADLMSFDKKKSNTLEYLSPNQISELVRGDQQIRSKERIQEMALGI